MEFIERKTRKNSSSNVDMLCIAALPLSKESKNLTITLIKNQCDKCFKEFHSIKFEEKCDHCCNHFVKSKNHTQQ